MKRKKTRQERPSSVHPSDSAVRPSHRFGGWRGWLLRLTLLVVSPIVFLGVVELGLRVGHYGYPSEFFVGPDANGIYASNPSFGWRFFPRSIARAPQPCFLSAKPAGTIRIFVLGSSAAMGTPEPSLNFGRILEVMLRRQYPGVEFEVVNAAMTAINSHVVLEIAKDCAAHQPDLFIVYMGNNEVVGPYGPGTVFQSWSPNVALVRAAIWAKSLRLGQLSENAIAHFHRNDDTVKVWRGMEMFLNNRIAADDPRLAKVYATFRQNLTDLCGVARRAGVPIVLSTVAVNLRDCPPLASLHRSDLAKPDFARWESLDRAGIALETSGKIKEAIKQYEAAAQIDPSYAELQFRLGRCLAAAGQPSEARDRFLRARDLDALRFRADTQINATVREVAAERHADRVFLADGEQAIGASDLAHDGIPGENLFYEHVHLTFQGNYLLARAVLDQVSQALPESVRSHRTGRVPSADECARSLVLTPWDEFKMNSAMAELTSAAPFTEQLEHASRQAAAYRRVDRLRKAATTPQSIRETTNAYEAALAKSPDDWQLHQRFGVFIHTQGRFEESARHWRAVAEKIPWTPAARVWLSNALREQGKLNEALAEYRKALEIDPNHTETLVNLGETLLRQKKTDEALSQFRKALAIDPQCAAADSEIGLALLEQGQVGEGTKYLRKAVEVRPENAAPRYDLALALAHQGRNDESIAQYRAILETWPEDFKAHSRLAMALASRGATDESIIHFRKALDSDPEDAELHFNLGIALAERGDIEEAIVHYRKAIENGPNNSEFHNNLGILLAGQQRFDEAIGHFRKAIEIAPHVGTTYQNLGAALYLQGKLSEAVAAWFEGIRACPDCAPLLNQTARALATSDQRSIRNGPKAVEFAERAVKLTNGRDPIMLDTLAGAYAETGRFPAALATAEHALSLASAASNITLADAIHTRIALYKSGSPFREAAPHYGSKSQP